MRVVLFIAIAVSMAMGCASTPDPKVEQAYKAGNLTMDALSTTRADRWKAVQIARILPPGKEQALWTLKAAAIWRELMEEMGWSNTERKKYQSFYWSKTLKDVLGENKLVEAAKYFDGPAGEAVRVSRAFSVGSPASRAFLEAAVRIKAAEDVEDAISMARFEATERDDPHAAYLVLKAGLDHNQPLNTADYYALNLVPVDYPGFLPAISAYLMKSEDRARNYIKSILAGKGLSLEALKRQYVERLVAEVKAGSNEYLDELWTSYLSGKVTISSVDTKKWLFERMAENGDDALAELWGHYESSERAARDVLPVDWVLGYLAKSRNPDLRSEAFSYYYFNSEMDKADIVAETLKDTRDISSYQALRSGTEAGRFEFAKATEEGTGILGKNIGVAHRIMFNLAGAGYQPAIVDLASKLETWSLPASKALETAELVYEHYQQAGYQGLAEEGAVKASVAGIFRQSGKTDEANQLIEELIEKGHAPTTFAEAERVLLSKFEGTVHVDMLSSDDVKRGIELLKKIPSYDPAREWLATFADQSQYKVAMLHLLFDIDV